MSIPEVFLCYLVAFSPAGLLWVSGKAAIYCLFQLPLNIPKAILVAILAVAIHFLSSFTGIAFLCGMPPTVKIDDTTSVALDFLYAGTVSAIIELACLYPLRNKLRLKRIGATVLIANTVYYLGLFLGLLVFSGVPVHQR